MLSFLYFSTKQLCNVVNFKESIRCEPDVNHYKLKNVVKITESPQTFLFGTEQLICQTNPKGWMVGVWDCMKLG